jgi:drug/metabolite transporter (DMT)-like permease
MSPPSSAARASSTRGRDLLLVVTLTLCWGATWPAMKLALREIPPWTFRSLCLAIGGLGLLAIIRVGGQRLRIPQGERGALAAVTLFNVTAWHLLSAYGLTMIEATRGVIIAYTMPLWTVLLARMVLGEPLVAERLLALALGLSGLAVLLGPDLYAVWATPTGALMMLGAALSWAVGTVLTKRRRWTLSTASLTAWQLVLGGIPVVAGALLLEPSPSLHRAGWAALAGTAYAALVGVIFCHYTWFLLLGRLPAGLAALMTLGIPIVGVLTSAAALGERIGPTELSALVLVVAALAVLLFGPAIRTRAPDA